MKITTELLRFYNFPLNQIEYFTKSYPDGADFTTLTSDDNFTVDFYHRIYQYCYLDDNDIIAYKLKCHIDESSSLMWNSTNITNSHIINYSDTITNSTAIHTCFNVVDSQYISNSSNITGSTYIRLGQDINDSSNIYQGKAINISDNLFRSTNIDSSRYIVDGSNLSNCERLYYCTDCNECYCSGFLHNCNHCLFCLNLTDKEYYIFNKKISKEAFSRCKERVSELLQAETAPIVPINKENYFNFNQNVSMSSVFDMLSDDFFQQIKNMPNITELNFTTLFFRTW